MYKYLTTSKTRNCITMRKCKFLMTIRELAIQYLVSALCNPCIIITDIERHIANRSTQVSKHNINSMNEQIVIGIGQPNLHHQSTGRREEYPNQFFHCYFSPTCRAFALRTYCNFNASLTENVATFC